MAGSSWGLRHWRQEYKWPQDRPGDARDSPLGALCPFHRKFLKTLPQWSRLQDIELMLENPGCNELFWGTTSFPPTGLPLAAEATWRLLACPGSSLQVNLCAGSWGSQELGSWPLWGMLGPLETWGRWLIFLPHLTAWLERCCPLCCTNKKQTHCFVVFDFCVRLESSRAV